MPANATKKPFHFEELSNEEHKNYANNLNYDREYEEKQKRGPLQHDTHVNGRMLHSNLQGRHDRKVDRDWGISQKDNDVISQKDKGLIDKASKRQPSHKVLGINQVHGNLNLNPKRSYKSVYNTSDKYVPKIGLSGKHGVNGLLIQEAPATQIQTPRLPRKLGSTILSSDGFPVVMGNIYWSREAEGFVPKGKYYNTFTLI